MSQPFSDLPLRTLHRFDENILSHAAAWAMEDRTSEPVMLRNLFESHRSSRLDPPILWFGVPADGSLPSLFALLPEAEWMEIRCLRSDKDKWSVAAARAAARILLSKHLDCPACDITFIRDDHGKTLLDPRRHGAMAGQLHFSISHTRELVAVAIGRNRIGIDVEMVRDFPELMQVARMQFAHEMRHNLQAAETNTERAALFFRFWTLGEAFIKATGQGITHELQSFAFSAHDRPVLTRVNDPWGPPDRWRFGALGWGVLPPNGHS